MLTRLFEMVNESEEFKMKVQYGLGTMFLILNVFAFGVAFGYLLPSIQEVAYHLIYYLEILP